MSQEIIYEVSPTVKFRKMPAYGKRTRLADQGQAAAEARCWLRDGHILTVHGDEIRCCSCGAIWRDEGF